MLEERGYLKLAPQLLIRKITVIGRFSWAELVVSSRPFLWGFLLRVFRLSPCLKTNISKSIVSCIFLVALHGSYRSFLDSKFKTFSILFSKTVLSFPGSRSSNRWSIETLKNAGAKSFFMMCCKRYRRDWIRIYQNEKKKNIYKALVVALKKTSRLFYHFSRLFSSLENCWANFKPFSRLQDSVRTLSLGSTREIGRSNQA